MNLADQIAFIEYAHNRRGSGVSISKASSDLGVDRRTILRWIRSCEHRGWGLRFDEEIDQGDRRKIVYRLRGSPMFLRQDEIERYRSIIDDLQRKNTELETQLSAVRSLAQQALGVTG